VLKAPCEGQISDMYPLRFLSEDATLAAVSRSVRRIIEAGVNGHHILADNTTEYLKLTQELRNSWAT
jgi:hypothetical protein